MEVVDISDESDFSSEDLDSDYSDWYDLKDIKLTENSIAALSNGIEVPQPIVQLLGYKAMKGKNDETNYRLALSDGLNLNSYFYVSYHFGELIVNKRLEYGTLLRLEDYTFKEKENDYDNTKLIVFLTDVTVLIKKDIFGEPRPLRNLENEKIPLTNLNRTSPTTRNFYNFTELRNNLISIRDLRNMPDGNCAFILKLTVNFKYPIESNDTCNILNITMTDPMDSMINVIAYNLLADKINKIFEINKKYYITDFTIQRDQENELQLQADSVVIECIDEPNNENNFSVLMNKNVNTYTDLIGVCTNMGKAEKLNTSFLKKDTKRTITLVDKSLTTIKVNVFGENIEKFVGPFSEPPVVMIKQAILKEFNGVKFFSMGQFSELTVNPMINIAFELRNWYCSHSLNFLSCPVQTNFYFP